MIDLFVEGSPKPQSRPRVAVRGGRAMAYNADSGDMVKWKKALDSALAEIPDRGLDGPMRVELAFRLPRPKSHHRTGKFSHLLKDSAPGDHQSRADLDNLAKVILDKITRSGYWIDDNQVISLSVTKCWNDYTTAGCGIRVVPSEKEMQKSC